MAAYGPPIGPTGVCFHIPTVTCPNCAPWAAPPPYVPSYPAPTQQGWVCPVCGTVLAPWVSECKHGSTWTSNDITVTFNVADTGDLTDPQAGELQ